MSSNVETPSEVLEIENILKQSEIEYESINNGSGFVFSFDVDCKLKEVSVLIQFMFEFSTVTSSIKITTDKAYYLPIAEYITRANCGQLFGYFCMDFEDGEVYYHQTVDLSDCSKFLNILQKSIDNFTQEFETYGDGLFDVMHGIKTPDVAISESEAED